MSKNQNDNVPTHIYTRICDWFAQNLRVSLFRSHYAYVRIYTFSQEGVYMCIKYSGTIMRLHVSLAYNFFVMRVGEGVISTLSNQWWMAGAGHLASLRGTGVGHYETAATRSLQRQSCQPKVGLPITHLPPRKKKTNRNPLQNLLHSHPYHIKTNLNTHTHTFLFTFISHPSVLHTHIIHYHSAQTDTPVGTVKST